MRKLKVLFISIGLPNLENGEGGLYSDLITSLSRKGHHVTVLAQSLDGHNNGVFYEGSIRAIRVPLDPFVGNIPFYKKGLRILAMSHKYKRAFRKYLTSETFDIVLMATPPVSLYDVASLIKKKTGAKLYLILRDIHPECLNRKAISKEIVYRTDVYDECKKPFGTNIIIEKILYYQAQRLYRVSDMVGCMSPGNQAFFKSIAPYFEDCRITLLPNWYAGRDNPLHDNEVLRRKYNLEGKFVAIFGGTIGPAQAVWNIACLAKNNLHKQDVVFLVVGRGEKKEVLEEMARKDKLTNMRFLDFLPREDYERILEIADIGLISIDEKYSVPTCPSKILGYMALGIPVLAMFNEGNDYGDYYIGQAQCGLWTTGLDNEKMFSNFDLMYYDSQLRKQMGMNGYSYYKNHFTSDLIADTLINQLYKI